jgi:hypothetical protein
MGGASATSTISNAISKIHSGAERSVTGSRSLCDVADGIAALSALDDLVEVA